MTPPVVDRSDIWDVIVVGAGASGLSCARDLMHGGLRVLVIEARDRIGGRIHTIRDRGIVEAGAEFVHGEKAATWEFIRKEGCKTEEWQSDGPGKRLYVRGGQMLPEPVALSAEIETIHQKIGEYSGSEISVERIICNQNQSELARFYAARQLVDIESAELNRLSALGFNQEQNLTSHGSRNFWITDGYSRVVESLAKDLRLLLSHPVTRIAWRHGDVSVESGKGAVFQGRRLVLTIAIGAMRKGPRFDPELPWEFTSAIQAIGFGNSTKLTIWLDDMKSLPDFTLLDSDGMFGHFWPRPFDPTPVLVGFSGGKRADQLTAMGEEAAIQTGIEELTRAFGRAIRNKITAAQHFTWSDDPYAMGSYSYPALGMGSACSILRRPVADTVYYTGEAVNDQGHSATVHGAIEAGRTTAAQILRGAALG